LERRHFTPPGPATTTGAILHVGRAGGGVLHPRGQVPLPDSSGRKAAHGSFRLPGVSRSCAVAPRPPRARGRPEPEEYVTPLPRPQGSRPRPAAPSRVISSPAGAPSAPGAPGAPAAAPRDSGSHTATRRRIPAAVRRFQQDVARLDVAVDHALPVGVVQGLR